VPGYREKGTTESGIFIQQPLFSLEWHSPRKARPSLVLNSIEIVFMNVSVDPLTSSDALHFFQGAALIV
jgi:hypothetical protein